MKQKKFTEYINENINNNLCGKKMKSLSKDKALEFLFNYLLDDNYELELSNPNMTQEQQDVEKIMDIIFKYSKEFRKEITEIALNGGGLKHE